MSRVAVLGCGPTGLVAAHAAISAGHDVTVYSKKRKSEMFGAQYLHEAIPGLPAEGRSISYELWGTVEQYRQKVYGLDDVEVSPESLLGKSTVYDIRAAYDDLWDKYSPLIRERNLDNEAVRFASRYEKFDAIINTVPAPAICGTKHTFMHQAIWAAGDAPERGIRVQLSNDMRDLVGTDHVVCSGLRWHDWYRFSVIFGHATVEWPYVLGHTNPPYPSASLVYKPLASNCDCWSGTNVYSVGRYGAWRKGVLVNHAYHEVIGLLR